MTRAEFIEFVARLEADFPVDEWTVDGLHVWPMVRLALYSFACNVIVPSGALGTPASNVRALADGMARWSWSYLRDARKNRRPDVPCDVLFLSSSVGVQPRVDGRRINPHVAPYVDLFGNVGWRSAVWEMAPYARYNIPRYTPSFFVQPHIFAARLATLRVRGETSSIRLHGFEDVLRRIRQERIAWRYETLPGLLRDVAYLLRMARMFERWLRRARPRLVTVANYGLQEQAICLAGHRLGIPILDIQHGVQGESHPAYGRWTRVPSSGYETRPTYYWCWDDESAAAINAWAAQGDGVPALVGGNAFADRWRHGTSELVRSFDAAVERLKSRAPAAQHVLVSLDSLGDVIPAPVANAIDMAPHGWRFWPRLHPVNQAVQRRALEAELRLRPHWRLRLMDWRFTTEAPLPGLLRHVDAHLTVSWSSVVKDAAVEGVASVASAQRAAEFFPELIENGALRIGTTGASIIDAIATQMRQRTRPREPNDRGTAAIRRLASLLT